uniref:Uncharacterized protein n=1 Tax=Arundo donax TaxID=35708 RepID=A0A0A9DXG6_ARUDO
MFKAVKGKVDLEHSRAGCCCCFVVRSCLPC